MTAATLVELGERIRQARLAHALSQAELSTRLDIDRSALVRRHRPSPLAGRASKKATPMRSAADFTDAAAQAHREARRSMAFLAWAEEEGLL